MKLHDYSAAQQSHADITEFHQIPTEMRQDLALRARYMLDRERQIRLGAFCAAIRRGDRRMKYGSLVDNCSPHFRRLSDEGVWSLYECILFQLEREEGPLVCADRWSNQRPTWGYADPVCDNCGAHATKPADAIPCRNLVQIQGHPDWRFKKAGKLPDTVWTKSYARTALAA